jgi:hypothetical protein
LRILPVVGENTNELVIGWIRLFMQDQFFC